jgi:mRNA interferase MazF
VKRGELYRVPRPHERNAKRFRVFVVVSRQTLIDSRFSTVVCAPVYSMRHGLRTQVDVGPDEGLRHDSSVHCDELVSLQKSRLTQYVGSLGAAKLLLLDTALLAALGIDPAGRKGRWHLHDGDS